ncbi:MAG: hypothetical protein ACK5BQ_10050 [Ignavibacteria bacterium]|jgi:hypothetical protein
MSDERIEPSIEHEYIVEVETGVDKDTRMPTLVVRVTTAREFTSFAYEISLELSVDHAAKTMHLEVGGLSIPSVMMPSKGGAISERTLELLPAGTYQFTVAKKNRNLSTSFVIAKTGLLTMKSASNSFALIRA